jgi:tetratricopeptide (TPR) repeat protein
MLVGRTLELDILNASFRQMLEGKGNILFLTGEAGLGKTTLVHEWWKTVAPDSAIYAEAACSIPVGNVDVGRLEALQPWADVVAQLQSHEEQGKKKLDLKKLIFDSAPAWAWALPIVGGIAHGAMETARLVKEQQSDHNPSASNQQQVFQQYVNLLTKIAEQTPLVILLDDMHWADTSSTNLLFYLSRQITSKRILVFVTYRPDDALIGTDGKRHPVIQIKNEVIRYEAGKELPLQYLDRSAIRNVMQYIFSGYEADDHFENWLRKISDGNSLFVTQFIKTLQEDGHLGDNGAFIGAYDAIKIPNSALAVVEERTARLDDATRELLSYATAEGEEFTSYVLGQLTSKKPLELLRDLRKAEAVGLVESGKSTRQFANQTTSVFGFSHALFHKALYDGLLPEEREILHRQCYDILKSEWDRLASAKDRSMSLASKLLTHAEKCREYESAAEIALEAAHGAWQTFAEAEALDMLAHVKRFAENSKASLPVQKRESFFGDAFLLRANIDILRGRYEDAMNAARNAVTHFENLRDERKIIEALNQQASSFLARSYYKDSESCAMKALELAEKIGDVKGIAISSRCIGNVHYRLGACEKALKYYTRNLEIQESFGDQREIASALSSIGNVYSSIGEYEKALEYHVRSCGASESIGDLVRAALSENNMGGVYGHIGEIDKALNSFMRCLEISETIGDQSNIAMALGNIGVVQTQIGTSEKALEYYTRSMEIFESIGSRSDTARMLNNIGTMHQELGANEKALEYHTRSLDMMESLGDQRGIVHALLGLGNTNANIGETENALEYYNRSLEISESIGDRSNVGYLLHNMGSIYRDLGNFPESRKYITRAQTIAKELKEKDLIADTHYQYGLLNEAEAKLCNDEVRKQKIKDAISHLEKGLEILIEIKKPDNVVRKFENKLKTLRTECL